ncbi:hypothetical protein DM860_014357 [Cuscuta australis]|uniref:Subtilisin-like protease fibronectin type-III domain-containing protein n=1 Tax=Cuscuta australis TaxID=267555 RepID=A0A328DEJ8_9ASTE|nr:hypothetical protein DM860_014357 [Cuscuta australis]
MIVEDAHIVYMGHSSGESNATKAAHVKLLGDVLGSPLAAREAMLYSYKHGFSGFAARLTEAQAETLAAMPGVVYVSKSGKLKLHTTRSWDFLGLSLGAGAQPPQYGKMGEGSIIGLIDTGVWPESPSFKDETMGPVPKRWRGICQSGVQFNASHCNRKLIGAPFFAHGAGPAAHFYGSFLSPRDSIGHGTHTASTAGGSVVPGVSFKGLARGVARGGATRARLAVYKVCWMETCDESDILKAFDMAIHDGVDVISISIGRHFPLFPNGDQHDSISLGFYHAVARGITVVASAGNTGPDSYSVVNVAPWLITVGACTTDRRFLAGITLGDNSTFWGQSWYTGKALDGFREIVYPEATGLDNNECGGGNLDGKVTGKIVLCFRTDNVQSMLAAASAVAQAGGVGLIYAQHRDDNQVPSTIPSIKVDMEVGTRILVYVKQSRKPMAKVGVPSNIIGVVASPRVVFFSSRGPNSLFPHILKPDIVAPGVDILAAYPSIHGVPKYQIDSGTSMSTPHVAGVVALIKAEHPDWSPGAIRSALITSAWSSQRDGDDIRDGGIMDKVSDLFDIGGGFVNPIGALDPGLVYNTTMEDYRMASTMDHLINLPYIIILDLGVKTITVIRIVTNVGPNTSVYEHTALAPFGTTMKVEPKTLRFNGTKTATFQVTFTRTIKFQGGFSSGSLTWRDGHRRVRIPVAVRIIDLGMFGDV